MILGHHYVLRRTLQAIGVMWAAFTATFVILYALPGDPVAIMLDARGDGAIANAAQVALLRGQYGFDKPILIQYSEQLMHALRGDFGQSIQTGQGVASTILGALPQTLALALLAWLLALAFGSTIALLGTYPAFSRWRDLVLALPSLCVSVPVFWLGLVLLQVFSFHWHLFPAMGNTGLVALILPALTLAIPVGAGYAQVLARSLDAELAQAYVQTAYSKGASDRRVQWRHVLRNALLPALTLAGMSVGYLLGGSVVTETVFSRVGVGRLIEMAVQTHDIPMVQGLVVLTTLVFVGANLAVDLLCVWLDPRARTVSRSLQERSA